MKMILICLCVLAGAAIGCGEEEDEGVTVMATTAIAADVARAVTGPDAEVQVLLPGSASPHDYGASAKDRARLEEADVVVAWGAGLEATLPLDELDRDPLELAGDANDPHVWMDPTLVAEALPSIADALADADPDHARGYRARAASYAEELARLDREVRHTLANVPSDRRKLVTSHDSLGHFARRYEFEFVGAPFGLAPEAEPSADTVASLIDRVEREQVPAVFAEDGDDPELMREIAHAANVEVVDDLLVEGFGGEVESYPEMLRFDAERIAEALAP